MISLFLCLESYLDPFLNLSEILVAILEVLVEGLLVRVEVGRFGLLATLKWIGPGSCV